MNIKDAKAIADAVVESMRPFCQRVEIGGSIRRERQDVKDIEIVAVPTWETAPLEEQVMSLFASPPRDPGNINKLHFWAMRVQQGVRWIKPGTSEIIQWQPKPEGKYWRGLIDPLTFGVSAEPIQLDLFLARPANWGMIFVIRTGSADFSAALMTHAKRRHMPCVEGMLTRGGRPVETPEEADVFRLRGISWVEPRDRSGWEAIRVSAQEARAV